MLADDERSGYGSQPMSFLREGRRFTAFAALGIAACQPTTDAECSGDCSASGGASGADGGSNAGASGAENEAGASGDGGMSGSASSGSVTPECAKDEACDDGSTCNGVERCVKGTCEPGGAFECPALAECSDVTDGATCSYSPSERFIVYQVDDLNPWWNLVGTSISDPEHPTQVNLSEGANDAEFNLLMEHNWSPDGRRLVFPTLAFKEQNVAFDQKFFWFDFTQPLAGQPRRVPDVPINEDFAARHWSPSSNAVLIGRNEFERTHWFAVRFVGTGAETALVPSDGQAELCNDDRTVAYEAGGATHLALLWASPVEEVVLPALLRGRSPDGKWLLLSDDEHAYLAKCGPSSELEPLAGPAAIAGIWSSDSKYVVYSEQDWDNPWNQDETEETTLKTLHAFSVDGAEPRTPSLQVDAVSPTVEFEPGGTRFLYRAFGDDSEPVRHLRDIANPEFDQVVSIADEQGNPIVPYLYWLGATGRWVYEAYLDIQSEDEWDYALYSLETAPTAKPRQLVTNLGERNYSDDLTKLIWVETQSGEEGDLSQVYTLDLEDEQSLPLALFPEPISGRLRFALYSPQARLLYRDIDFPESNSEIFLVPEDFASSPVSVKRGSVLGIDDYLSLQPRP